MFCIAQYHCRISTDSRKHATKRNFRRNRHPCDIRGVRNKTAQELIAVDTRLRRGYY